jgi:hypothetical protein
MNVLKRWLKFDSPVNIYSKKETFAAIQQARKSMLDGMLFIDLLIDFFGVNGKHGFAIHLHVFYLMISISNVSAA